MLKLTIPQTFLILSSLLLSACELGKNPSDDISPNYHLLSDCEKSEDADDAYILEEALCGKISVFENRKSASGRRIDLNIMLLPATSPLVKPDPIFYLAGGPGQAAVDSGPSLFRLLKAVRRERDVILVDQRGTGESNSLACELDISIRESMSITTKEFETRQTEKLKSCLDEYDADPRLYTTPIAMDDLNEVREVLGYGQINLYGISYGTRAALVYVRRHEATVRSMIIDSVVPLTMAIPKNVANDAQSAFERLLADCKAQAGCHEAYPDLHLHLQELVDRLAQHPEEVTVIHPRTGESITGSLDPLMIGRIIRGVLYDRTLSRLLPLAIEEAYKSNFQPLSTLGYAFGGGDDGLGMSLGMMSSVLCSEDMNLVLEPLDAIDFDNALYSTLNPICQFWPKGDIPDGYFNPVVSDVPTLITSGELDPITPPKYGFEAAETLSNSRHIIVEGIGHAVTPHGCIPKLMQEFLDELDPQNLDTTCTEKLKRMPFFTSFAGPLYSKDEAKQND